MVSEDSIVYSTLNRADFVELDEAQKNTLVDLIQAAAPEFYGIVPLIAEQKRSLISGQVAQQYTELETIYVAREYNKIIGMASIVEVPRMQIGQLAALKQIMRLIHRDARIDFQRILKLHADSVEPLQDTSGIYLPRLAVSYEARGRGVGSQIMRKIIEDYKGRTVSLHVEEQNTPIIKLHRSFGFEFFTHLPFRFRGMSK